MRLLNLFCFSLVLFYGFQLKGQSYTSSNTKKIIIQLKDAEENKDSVSLTYYSYDKLESEFKENITKVKDSGNITVFQLQTTEPIYIEPHQLTKSKRFNFYLQIEPDDSLFIDRSSSNPVLSGRGSEKFELQMKLEQAKLSLKNPTNASHRKSNSLIDFLEWDSYLNNVLNKLLSIIDSSKNSISDKALKYIKCFVINKVEDNRLDKFWSLIQQADEFGLSNLDLCRIWDSCFYKEPAIWLRTLPDLDGSYGFIRAEVFRKYGFSKEHPSLQTEAKRRLLYFDQAKQTYNGETLERLYVQLITVKLLNKVGFTSEVEQLIDKYYKEAKNTRLKKYVSEYEAKARLLRDNQVAPDFYLWDTENRLISKTTFNKKIVLMDFWFTGCKGCKEIAPVLRQLEEKFKKDTNVIFVSISIDTSYKQWLKSIQSQQYSSPTALNLYTGGRGVNHSIIRDYQVNSYPTLYLLDSYGRIVKSSLSDPRKDTGMSLAILIKRKHAEINDGPYVNNPKDNITATYVNNGKVISNKLVGKDNESLAVQTDIPGKTFFVHLKPAIRNEPCVFKRPEKLFVLSDIEGNFYALRKILESNSIIDSNFNWIFGNGHLIINGDLIDRGTQVTESLWLIYSLEEKAKQAGGYVHFILGNHEIMNLQGNHKYMHEKYKTNAALLGLNPANFFDEETVLGNWLRSKNIIELLGDLLFVHGGISKKVANLSLTIEQMNELSRKYYDLRITDTSNKSQVILFDSKSSPFWYRGYYEIEGDPNKPLAVDIDYILSKFGANQIITGHTIIADSISAHYQGRIINTDTRHAQGKSEGLLIHYNNFYRVSDSGNRIRLLNKNKDQKNVYLPKNAR